MLIHCAECHKEFDLEKKNFHKNGIYFCSKTCLEKRFPIIIEDVKEEQASIDSVPEVKIEKPKTTKKTKKTTKK